MYLEGRVCTYDSLKALAWFKHAGAHGFVHSIYNAAKIFLEGTLDGKVKKNTLAGLSLLEEVKKSGKIDVEGLMYDTIRRMNKGGNQEERN